jgi:carbamoyl-phosphate synthase large subunit
MRRLAVELGIPFLTTMAAAKAATAAIRALREGEVETNALRSYHDAAH